MSFQLEGVVVVVAVVDAAAVIHFVVEVGVVEVVVEMVEIVTTIHTNLHEQMAATSHPNPKCTRKKYGIT